MLLGQRCPGLWLWEPQTLARAEALMRGKGPQCEGPEDRRNLPGSFWQNEGGRKEAVGMWGQV